MDDAGAVSTHQDQPSQISIRLWWATGVTLLLLVATPFVIVGLHVRKHQRLVSLSDKLRNCAEWGESPVPNWLNWLPEWLSKPFFKRLDRLVLVNTDQVDEFVTLLREASGIPRIVMLITAPPGTLKLIADRHRLIDLTLVTTELTTDDAAQLTRMRSLEYVQITPTMHGTVNDWSWVHRLPDLRQLRVGSWDSTCHLGDADVRAIARCPRTVQVYAKLDNVAAESIGELICATQLRILQLSGEFRIVVPAEAIAGPVLKEVHFESRILDDESLEWLTTLSQVEYIRIVSDLVAFRFSGKSLPPSVEQLYANSPRLDDDSLEAVAGAVGLRLASFDSGTFTETGLRHFLKLPKLDMLDIGDTRSITEREIRILASLPRRPRLDLGLSAARHPGGRPRDVNPLSDETKRILHLLVPYLNDGQAFRCLDVNGISLFDHREGNPEFSHDNVERIFLERSNR